MEEIVTGIFNIFISVLIFFGVMGPPMAEIPRQSEAKILPSQVVSHTVSSSSLPARIKKNPEASLSAPSVTPKIIVKPKEGVAPFVPVAPTVPLKIDAPKLTPRVEAILAPSEVATFGIKEINKNVKKEVDYSGQERKIVSIEIVFENPKLVLKDGEWGMDVYLSADTTARDGSRSSFLNGENISRVNFSSPYKLTFGTFVLNENLQSSMSGQYATEFKVRDANSGSVDKKTVELDLGI